MPRRLSPGHPAPRTNVRPHAHRTTGWPQTLENTSHLFQGLSAVEAGAAPVDSSPMLAPTYSPALATAEILGLLTACPLTQTNPEDCGLHEYRKLPLADLYAMIRHASHEELEGFVALCESCPHRRGHGRCSAFA